MKDIEHEIASLLMQTMQTNKKISRSKAKEILEEIVKYLETDATAWLSSIQCRSIELVNTLIQCLVQDFIKEKFDCEIEDVEHRIVFSRLDENEDFKKLRTKQEAAKAKLI